MAEPNWVQVLQVMHSAEYPYFNAPDERTFPENHLFTAGAGLSQGEAFAAFRYLETVGLIEYQERHDRYWITEKGFNVIHDRELANQQQELIKQQNRTNQKLALLTVFIAISALAQAVVALQEALTLNLKLVALGSLIVTVAIFIGSSKFELLDGVTGS